MSTPRSGAAQALRLALLPALLLGGCSHDQLATRDVHRGPLAIASVEDVPVCGHDAEVERAKGERLTGELVSVSPDNLTLIGDQGLEAIPVADVTRVFVKVRPGRGGTILGTTVAGALSTISNGYGLIFTFPAWIVTGSAVGAVDAGRTTPQTGPTDPALASYARFPQGPPPGWPGPGAPPKRCLPSPTDPSRAAEIDPAGAVWIERPPLKREAEPQAPVPAATGP